MKIAVYTIALNEEKHVKRWYESAKDADLLLIADTGSTDKTRFVAKALGIGVQQISVDPWRFDVARNASLALVPKDFDICISLDMDEVLLPGWREHVEKAFREGNTFPTYRHILSRNIDGTVHSYFEGLRVHPRTGFIWKYPIHEYVVPIDGKNYSRDLIELEIEQIRDFSKSRSSYLNLLQTAVSESPQDWRMNHYLSREYFYNRDWVNVLRLAYQCDEIQGGWDIERASTYMWASEACHHLGFKRLAKWWAEMATLQAPNFYEAWHWRAHIAHLHNEWNECLDYSSRLLLLKRQTHHLVKPEVWTWWGYDLIALASHRLGLHEDAVKYGELALAGAPEIERLRNNLKYYKIGLEGNGTREQESSLESSKESSNPAELSQEIENLRGSDHSLLSLITPTRNRENDLIAQYDRLCQSTYSNWEWLVFDDSEKSPEQFLSIKDDRIRFFKSEYSEGITIGEKRNRLIEEAAGEIILHIDDDDLYQMDYLQSALDGLVSNKADLYYLEDFLVQDENSELWEYSSKILLPELEAWGFTYVYRRDIALKYPFPKSNWEDHFWFKKILEAGCQYAAGGDRTGGLVVKVVHGNNTSRFPWHLSRKLEETQEKKN